MGAELSHHSYPWIIVVGLIAKTLLVAGACYLKNKCCKKSDKYEMSDAAKKMSIPEEPSATCSATGIEDAERGDNKRELVPAILVQRASNDSFVLERA
jgi:hypothetical protein